MKKNILYIVKNFAVNGISKVVLNYAEFIDKSKFEISIFTGQPAKDTLIEQLKQNGIKVYLGFNKDSSALNYYKDLNNIMKKNKFDIVHIHGNSRLLIFELLIAKKNKCKIRIVHSHNTCCNHPVINRIVTPFFNSLYTYGIACGEEAGNWLFGKKNFEIINNGINVEQYKFDDNIRKKIRKKYNFNDKKVIGHVGSFSEQKNHKYILHIFKKLLEIDENYKLVLIGTGRLFDNIVTLSKELNIYDNIVFVGAVDNVYEWLQAMDLMILPSLYEGFPLVLVEWQSVGLPIIVSDKVTKNCNLTGLIEFLSIDVQEDVWVDKITSTKLLNRNKNSEKLLKIIKSKGFDISENVKKLERLYFNLIESVSD